jgi:hypothetical protein
MIIRCISEVPLEDCETRGGARSFRRQAGVRLGASGPQSPVEELGDQRQHRHGGPLAGLAAAERQYPVARAGQQVLGAVRPGVPQRPVQASVCAGAMMRSSSLCRNRCLCEVLLALLLPMRSRATIADQSPGPRMTVTCRRLSRWRGRCAASGSVPAPPWTARPAR